MKVMLVTERGARTRRFDLRRIEDLLSLTWAVAPACLTLVSAGLIAGLTMTALADHDERQAMAALQAEREAHADTRQRHAEELSALSAAIGQLQAKLLRLDALGARLVGVAGLEADEFQFGAPPAQGGAEPSWLASAPDPGRLQDSLDAASASASRYGLELRALGELLRSRQTAADARPAGLPVATGWISSYFGRRSDPFTGRQAHHRGIDLAGRQGSPVVAVASGLVVFSGRRAGYGNLVEIDHGGGLVTRYGHNEKNLVQAGDAVQRGDRIATLGATGRATGPHLHFEVHRHGRAVDPLAFVSEDST